MPESNSIGVVGVIIGGVSFLGGVATSLIGKGKRDQKIDSAVEQLKGLEGAPAKIEEYGKKLLSLEEAMKNLASSFIVDGNPRYITVNACKSEQGHCRDVWDERLLAGNVRFGNIEADIKSIESEIKEIKESQAANADKIIEEIRKKR